MEGLILYGINNIYTVWDGQREVLCRIKGKVLNGEKIEYNPLAPGDRVNFECTAQGSEQGQILDRLARKNSYQRWNKKGRCPQTFAANVDGVVLLTAATYSFFRPRFIDRGLILAELAGIAAIIVINKIDQGLDASVLSRCSVWQDLGYKIFFLSALKEEGLAEFNEFLRGKTLVLSGQSGVGKSTLINKLVPNAEQKTAELSKKFARGVHATNVARLFLLEGGGLIDTPGVRELELWGLEPQQLSFYFAEFGALAAQCRFIGCTHRTEPGCAVVKALNEGRIHPDRYESYLRIFEELEQRVVYG